MSTPVLLISEVTPKPGAALRVARAWNALPSAAAVCERRIYAAPDARPVLS